MRAYRMDVGWGANGGNLIDASPARQSGNTAGARTGFDTEFIFCFKYSMRIKARGFLQSHMSGQGLSAGTATFTD